jgi:membrane protein required for colicin V production
MDSLPFNIVDAVAIGLVVLSALFAYFRGFVREVMSIVAWGLAMVVTLAFFTYNRDLIAQYVNFPFAPEALAGGGVFILCLILFTALSIPLWALIGYTGLRSFDRALGVLFGFFRGWLFILVLWAAFAYVIPKESRPDFVAGSRITPYLNQGAHDLVSWMKEQPYSFFQDAKSQGWFDAFERALRSNTPTNQETFQSLNSPQPLAPTTTEVNSGYSQNQRTDLSRLLNSAD